MPLGTGIEIDRLFSFVRNWSSYLKINHSLWYGGWSFLHVRNFIFHIVRCENALKRFLFSNSLWKTRKKNVLENFFYWSYGGQIWGQKSTHTIIDDFTKNGPNRQNWVFFIGKRPRMMRIRFSTRFWQNRNCDSLILQLRLQIGQSQHPNFGIF
jgi:hypothetical protein